MKKILCFHHLNGFSGSPNILATVINGLEHDGFEITLATSLNNKGFLSDVRCREKISIPYVFKENIINRFLQLLRFQIRSVAILLRTSKASIVYINTTWPVLPAVVAKLRGQAVVCHVHEAFPKKALLNRGLSYLAQLTADKIICVSDYVRDELAPKYQNKAEVICNALSPAFIEGKLARSGGTDRKRVLMISSARAYKGIFEYCRLAAGLGLYEFTLVCDISKEEVARLFREHTDVPNLRIYGTQTNLHRFYANTDAIMNLSDPNRIIETFGLTILEGMSYGLPAIVPPIGGITELVEDGVNGYRVDMNDRDRLAQCLKGIFASDLDYARMSENAFRKAAEFSAAAMVSQIEKLMTSL